MMDQRISCIAQNGNSFVAHDIAIEVIIDAWGACNDSLIFGMEGCSL